MSEFESIDEDYEAWEDDFGESDFGESDFEAAPRNRQPTRRPPIRRAPPRGNPAVGVQGRQYGVVRTPQGDARIELPGKFPTVDEFKQTITKLQQDIAANSAGIGQLTSRLQGDSQIESSTRNKHVHLLRRSIKRMQWATLLALTVPLVMEAARPEEARAFQPKE